MQRNQITPQKDGREGIEPAIPTAEAIPQPTMQLSLSDWICERRPLQIGFIVLLNRCGSCLGICFAPAL